MEKMISLFYYLIFKLHLLLLIIIINNVSDSCC